MILMDRLDERQERYSVKALRSMTENGDFLFRKFVSWTPARDGYDADFEFGKVRKITVRHAKFDTASRGERVEWDYSHLSIRLKDLYCDVRDPDFWDCCRVESRISFPSFVSGLPGIFERLGQLADGGWFDQDWADTVGDDAGFERMFGKALTDFGATVDVVDGRGMLFFDEGELEVVVTFEAE